MIIIIFYSHRDAEDTKVWIDEKDAALSSTDYGRDLATVQALQRKHEAIERDLAALEEKVNFNMIIIFFVINTGQSVKNTRFLDVFFFSNVKSI